MKLEEFEDLEPQQYQNIYQSEDTPLKNISGQTSRSLIYFGLGLFVVMLVLSLLIHIPREINMPFLLKGGRSELVLQYAHDIFIREKFVSTGQWVEQGDPLFTITSPKIVEHIKSINSLENDLLRLNTSRKDFLVSTQNLIHKKIKGISEHIQLTVKGIQATQMAQDAANKSLKRKLELAEYQHERNKKLYDETIISQTDLERSEAELAQTKSELVYSNENYTLQILQLKNSLQSFKNEKQSEQALLEKSQMEYDIEKEKILESLKLKKQNLILDYGTGQIEGDGFILTSRVRGLINLINEPESELESGEILAKIQTNESAHYAYIEAQPSQIGQLKVGQRAILKFASFPHYYYGTIKAEIGTKSNSPDADGNFPLRAYLTDTGDLESHITKGMTGRASVILEEKSVFDHMFRVFMQKVNFD